MEREIEWERKRENERKRERKGGERRDPQTVFTQIKQVAERPDCRLPCISTRDRKFSIQIVSDWPQMGQIWDFLRSVSVHFGSMSLNVLKLILKNPRFDHLWPI